MPVSAYGSMWGAQRGTDLMSGVATREVHGLVVRSLGEGPDLVLLHGGAGSWTHWIRNIPVLAKYFTVHALDLPGFGDSPDFSSDLRDQDYFDWVAKAVSSVCVGLIHVAGFSFGGSITAAIAVQLQSRLAGMSLIAPGSFGEPVNRNVRFSPVNGTRDRRAAARFTLQQIMFANPDMADEHAVSLQMHNVVRSRFNSRRISWQDRIESDLKPLLCPIQMIWGKRDSLAFPSVVARVERCRHIKAITRFDIVPEAGHWVQYEQAAHFDRTLLAFFESVKR